MALVSTIGAATVARETAPALPHNRDSRYEADVDGAARLHIYTRRGCNIRGVDYFPG